MARSLTLALSLSCFALVGHAWADQITLTNGDRVTGTILRSDTKTLVLKTDTAGDLTFKWDSISGISAPGPLYIVLNDNQTVVGAVDRLRPHHRRVREMIQIEFASEAV